MNTILAPWTVALVFGAPEWIAPALALGAAFLALLLVAQRGGLASARVRWTATALKATAVALLLFCLPSPERPRSRAVPGENQLLVLVDASRSLQVRDRGAERARAELLRDALREDAAWIVRAGQDFDLARYTFGERLRGRDDFAELGFDEPASHLRTALERLRERHRERPVAGILLFTDGNASGTFDATFPWDALPPLYVVPQGTTRPARDLGFERVAVRTTDFERSPITVTATLRCLDAAGRAVEVALHDEGGAVLERRSATPRGDDERLEMRFQTAAPSSGVAFHRLSVRFAEPPDDDPAAAEATLENNEHWVASERRAGPFRVLYVSGRPNWEYKFLRRALALDTDVELVALLRVAKRQARFTFRPAGADRRNQLFEGFEDERGEGIEAYDEPVMVRLGTRDALELRGGFPQKREDLYAYHAVVVDDLEAAFFSHDQRVLLQRFVSERGGGFLALGGAESFADGGWSEGPLADLLPVYLDGRSTRAPGAGVRLGLTREGWLEPWIRLRLTEPEEQDRLARMPRFATSNAVGRPKPGASVLWHATDERGRTSPALVTQRFGKGRAAAVPIGDLWRWHLRREDPTASDLSTAWRQTLRWLVADVPRRVELEHLAAPDGRTMDLRVRLRNARYEAEGQARVRLEIRPPDGELVVLDAQPSSTEAGVFVASFVPRLAGVHRASAHVEAFDGAPVETRTTGWVAEPAAREFAALAPNLPLLEELATRTGGRIVPLDALDTFAEELAYEDVPRATTELTPLWHRLPLFLLVLVCLCAEWGLRRSRGLP